MTSAEPPIRISALWWFWLDNYNNSERSLFYEDRKLALWMICRPALSVLISTSRKSRREVFFRLSSIVINATGNNSKKKKRFRVVAKLLQLYCEDWQIRLAISQVCCWEMKDPAHILVNKWETNFRSLVNFENISCMGFICLVTEWSGANLKSSTFLWQHLMWNLKLQYQFCFAHFVQNCQLLHHCV